MEVVVDIIQWQRQKDSKERHNSLYPGVTISLSADYTLPVGDSTVLVTTGKQRHRSTPLFPLSCSYHPAGTRDLRTLIPREERRENADEDEEESCLQHSNLRLCLGS